MKALLRALSFLVLAGVAGLAHALTVPQLQALLQAHPDLLFVDVREGYEHRLGHAPELTAPRVRHQAIALSQLPQALPDWLQQPKPEKAK